MEETEYEKYIKKSSKREVFEWGTLYGAALAIIFTLLCAVICWLTITRDERPDPKEVAIREIQ